MVHRSSENETPADYEHTQQHETITSSVRIATLLRPVMERHIILTATLPDSNIFFNTVLLAIEPENGLLVIDELNPKLGHDLLIKSKQLTLHAMLEGVDINFTINLKKAGNDKGIAYYDLEYPQSIRYLQRRNTFRVPISGASKIEIEIHISKNNIFTGELSDISAEGMCIRFPKKTSMGLDNYTGEAQCIIKLPDNRQIQCAFKVRRSSLDQASNNRYVGGCFERIDKIQRRAIERFVSELQRTNRKKMNR